MHQTRTCIGGLMVSVMWGIAGFQALSTSFSHRCSKLLQQWNGLLQ